jgi:hypothetical protein
MRTMTANVGALLLLLSSAMTTHAQVVITQPDLAAGSQLIFYYDAREGFTTFVNIRNGGGDPLTVKLDVWGPTFETNVTQTFALAAGGVRVVDIGALKNTDGLAAQQGIAVASIVDGSGLPIHITRGLAGNFTVANLATGSAWGSPAVGRSARNVVDGMEPANGTVVNGSLVVYQIIQPNVLALATYYNPQNLAPVQDHGNQLIFVNFKDGPAGAPLTVAQTNWLMIATRGADGTQLSATFAVTGVIEHDIVTVLGTEANGAPGGGGFIRGDGTASANRFIFFVQSLGTFGTGYLLPHL